LPSPWFSGILPASEGGIGVGWLGATILSAAALAVVVWLGVEIHRYFRGRSVISGKQLILRSVVAALVMGLVAMMLWGAFYPWRSDQALTQLTYWSAALALALVVVILAMRDWRILLREKHLRQADLYRQLDEEIGAQSKAKKDG
jgi:hypothetical protein